MATQAETLAHNIVTSILQVDAGGDKTLGDLTSSDSSGTIYNSWYLICQPLVEYIQASGSIPHDLQIYANNTAAISGGLMVGDFYRTGTDPDNVCIVH